MKDMCNNSSCIKAEVFDKMQFLFEEYKYNDHQLHCIISFNNRLKREYIKKAVIYTFGMMPILGCRYVEDDSTPYWERIPEINFEKAVVFVKGNDKDILDKLITSTINEHDGPQIKIFILASARDTMLILANHMVFDAAGFKEYIYLLSFVYSSLVKNPAYTPKFSFDGSRSIDQIADKFSAGWRAKALMSKYSENRQKSSFCFPLDKASNPSPFILTYKLHEERYRAIKNYCNKYNFTVNDVILAAYYRVLFKLFNLPNKTSVKIPLMIDMRRYLSLTEPPGLCNLTSIIPSSIECNFDDTFHDTAIKVNKAMNLIKSRLPGVGDFIKLSSAFRLLPYSKLKKLLKLFSLYPKITLTNIGILDSKKLHFEGMIIDDAFMTGSIKYPPYFQLALTTYAEKMTFSINLHGSQHDRENIRKFFICLDSELSKENLL